jgi:hypothetical protein
VKGVSRWNVDRYAENAGIISIFATGIMILWDTVRKSGYVTTKEQMHMRL